MRASFQCEALCYNQRVPFGLWLALALAVAIEGKDVDPSVLASAVAACDQVVPEHCALIPGADAAAFHASFTADPAFTEARIEIRRGSAEGPVEHARTLSLDPLAPLDERARTLGLVIAAHVLAQPAPTPEPPRVSVPARPKPASMRASLDAAALVGSAFDTGGPRWGGMVRGAYLPGRSFVGVTGSLRGAARAHSDPRVGWLQVTAGALAHYERGRFAADARLELVGERVAASAASTDVHALRLGGLAGGELLGRIARAHWLFAGVEAGWLAPPVSLFVRGHARGPERTPSWTLLTGFRQSW